MESYFPAASGYNLFKSNLQASIGINDTIQGYLGDCWLLAMIASIAEFPDRIFNMFDTKSYNGKGVYSIKMYEMGVPISVIIDDFLPINTSWGTNTYAWINTDKELWPVLIEKAFSKLMGNYETIEGGWPQQAGTNMSGTWGESMNSSSYTAASLYALVKSWD